MAIHTEQDVMLAHNFMRTRDWIKQVLASIKDTDKPVVSIVSNPGDTPFNIAGMAKGPDGVVFGYQLAIAPVRAALHGALSCIEDDIKDILDPNK